jgi:hypothetical protein
MIIACDKCRHGKAVREREYHCRHPVIYPRGKVIYRETFGVLKKVGCGSAAPTKSQMKKITQNLNDLQKQGLITDGMEDETVAINKFMRNVAEDSIDTPLTDITIGTPGAYR